MADLTEEQLKEIEDIVYNWSLDKTVKRASEELLELAVSLLHYDRGKADKGDVLDEMADVHIVLAHLKIKFGDYQVQLDNKYNKGANHE